MAHVSRRALERFRRGETSLRQRRQMARHLLRCEACGFLAFGLWLPGGSKVYEQVIRRLCRRSAAEHNRALEQLVLREAGRWVDLGNGRPVEER